MKNGLWSPLLSHHIISSVSLMTPSVWSCVVLSPQEQEKKNYFIYTCNISRPPNIYTKKEKYLYKKKLSLLVSHLAIFQILNNSSYIDLSTIILIAKTRYGIVQAHPHHHVISHQLHTVYNTYEIITLIYDNPFKKTLLNKNTL